MIWRGRREKRLVEQFVAALNAHDIARLKSLLAPDFTYIDSWREGVTGRDAVLAALHPLFAADPDFGIEVDRIDWREPHVLMTGRVNSQRFGHGRRAVWQVLVRDGVIAQYQSWAEGGPPPLSRLLAPQHAGPMGTLADERPQIDL